MIFALLFPDYFVLITVVSLLAAILNYGLTFAYLQRRFYYTADIEYTPDVVFSVFVSVMTFCTVFPLIVTFFGCEIAKYGLKFK